MKIKPLLYLFFIYIWVLILQMLANGSLIVSLFYLLLTTMILLIINIKNIKNYLLNACQYKKQATLLKYWVISDGKKNLHKKMVKKYYEKVNTVMYIFFFIFIISIAFLVEVLTVVKPMAIFALIAIMIGFLFCFIQFILYRFPIFITLIVPFISFFIVSYLYESNQIENLILLKVLFVLFAAISYGFICFSAQPYVIRNIHKNQLFINGVPNIILLIFTLSMNSIEKPKIDFTKGYDFSELPDEIQIILSNQEIANIIRDIIYQSQMAEFTSEITTYILMISIMIFTFSASLNIKMRHDNNKARNLLSRVRIDIMKHQKFDYSDSQKISYYGGSYYEDQLFSIPGVYEFIYEIEMNKSKI
ncbi:hypothetical protein [Mammaliicoccus sciuri]|uniref:hypothetical protein n=1 Tax=Mammaliicoccus sciuri TaxID=1296 RepID=UPI001951F1B8|nr:hypothetical protein [Mammaliicoccus sciuri]WQJ42258.1 hypothetical protein P3T99_00395 [Mammaliicoccus sciuri]WQK90691.1 hypothetical protein P3U26_00500 [Mammaliicoccus sciuri]